MATQSHTNQTLKILYWNARSINERKTELPALLVNVDVFVCVESWLKPTDCINITGFKSIRKDRLHARGGGILFLIRQHISCIELNNVFLNSQDIEVHGVRIESVSPVLDIIACSRIPHHGKILSQNEWHTLINLVDSNRDTIFLGDFNAHNAKWNCRTTDKNGEHLENSGKFKNLFLHNANTKTCLNKRSNTKSNIDLVFSTMNVAHSIEVTVYDEPFNSDHFPIMVSVNVDKNNMYAKKSFKITTTRTNWTTLQEKLEDNYNSFFTPEYELLTPSKKYDHFIEIIRNCIDQSTPAKKYNPNAPFKKSNPVPWWDSECDKIKRLRRAAFLKWQYSSRLDDLINYNKYCALAKRIYLKIKKSSVLKILHKASIFALTLLTCGINVKFLKTNGSK